MGRSKVLEELQAQTVVPDIWNNVSVDRYFQVGAAMFEETMFASNISFQYVSLKKFLNFSTKLFNHAGYGDDKNKLRRAWMKRAVLDAMRRLESVAKAIEDEETRKQEEYLFDCLEDEMHAPPGVASVLDVLPAPVNPVIHNVESTQKSIEEEIPISNNVIVPPKTKKTLAEIYDRLRIPDSEDTIGESGSTMAQNHSKKRHSNSLLVEYDGIDEGKGAPQGDEVGLGPLGRGFPGISLDDAKILQHVVDIFTVGLSIRPYITEFALLGGLYRFMRDDYHVSFTPVLDNKGLEPDLQVSRPAVETNRCFFLHLGIAVGIHPFALQASFRHMAALLLEDKSHEDASLMQDILPSVLQYAGLVDANALIFTWPQEFVNFRVCMFSGKPGNPLISCFSAREADPSSMSDVLIYCDGQHFTLLRPIIPDGKDKGISIVPSILAQARARQCVVQEHRVPINPTHSLWEITQRIVGNL